MEPRKCIGIYLTVFIAFGQICKLALLPHAMTKKKYAYKTLIDKVNSFVTHITENPPRHLVHIGFWLGIGQNVQKMAIFGPK